MHLHGAHISSCLQSRTGLAMMQNAWLSGTGYTVARSLWRRPVRLISRLCGAANDSPRARAYMRGCGSVGSRAALADKKRRSMLVCEPRDGLGEVVAICKRRTSSRAKGTVIFSQFLDRSQECVVTSTQSSLKERKKNILQGHMIIQGVMLIFYSISLPGSCSRIALHRSRKICALFSSPLGTTRLKTLSPVERPGTTGMP